MEQMTESIFPEKRVFYAGFWERFAAAFIDGLILMVPSFAVSFSLGGSSRLLPFFINILIGWLYSALQESGNAQATVGKRAMKIRVTTLDGERISFGQATGRHFAKNISVLILLIGYLMMLWDDKKQTLHDKLAGTLVVAG